MAGGGGVHMLLLTLIQDQATLFSKYSNLFYFIFDSWPLPTAGIFSVFESLLIFKKMLIALLNSLHVEFENLCHWDFQSFIPILPFGAVETKLIPYSTS